MRQALAILNDSLRALRSRSLFWMSLSISAVVAISLFGLISFNADGWRILWFETHHSEIAREGSFGARELMSWLFNGVFVFWWLSWGAIILAVVSTASILPDFLAEGSIEITLAKPITRLRLFFLKVLGALLFVTVQTTISVVLAYLLLGLKVDIWLHATLWAIPLIVAQFLYLYCVGALVAVMTRSSLAGLLTTLIFWVLVSLVQFSTNQVESMVAQNRNMIAQLETQIAGIEDGAAEQGRELTTSEVSRLAGYRGRIEPFRQQLGWFEPYEWPLKIVEMVIPKTADVQKIIADLSNAPTFSQLLRGLGVGGSSFRPAQFDEEEWTAMQEAGIAGERAVRDVNTATSLATSLAFAAVMLGIAGGLFCRRDF